MIVADASFWVSAFYEQDSHHKEADELLRRIVKQDLPVAAPVLALVELAGALFRRTKDPSGVEATLRYLQHQIWLTWVPLTIPFSEAASKIAISCSLRGADAVYVALAQQKEAPLITRDKEILARGQSAAVILTPTAWLHQNPDVEA